MLRLPTLTLFAVLATGCQSTQSDFGFLSSNNTPEPPAIRKLADAYLAALPPGEKPKNVDFARHDYVHGFRMGFTSPNATMSGGSIASARGFKAGQEFRRVHPDKTNETLVSFGYVFTESEGIWKPGFEQSGFKPFGARNMEHWWLSSMGADLPSDHSNAREGVRIKIAGFLSPKGHYGHFGGYDHEFFVTKFSL